jgi:hypothetical protein
MQKKGLIEERRASVFSACVLIFVFPPGICGREVLLKNLSKGDALVD